MADKTIKNRHGEYEKLIDLGDGATAPRMLPVNSDGTVLGTPKITSDLTPVVVNISTAVTTPIVTATASQTTRVHRMRLNVAGAQIITVLSNATVLEVLNFTAAGLFIWEFSTRPWYKTAANQALNFTTSAAVQVNGVVEYIKSA